MRGVLGFVVVLTLVVAPAGVAVADEKRSPDPTDRSNRPNDIAAISHSHGAKAGILRHTVAFDGEPDLPGEITFVFRYEREGGRKVRREVVVRSLEDGSLYGDLRDSHGKVVAQVPAGMEDPTTLFIEVPFKKLEHPRPVRYRWSVTSVIGSPKRDGTCQEESSGPPICRDRAPESGWMTHRLLVTTFV